MYVKQKSRKKTASMCCILCTPLNIFVAGGFDKMLTFNRRINNKNKTVRKQINIFRILLFRLLMIDFFVVSKQKRKHFYDEILFSRKKIIF